MIKAVEKPTGQGNADSSSVVVVAVDVICMDVFNHGSILVVGSGRIHYYCLCRVWKDDL